VRIVEVLQLFKKVFTQRINHRYLSILPINPQTAS